MKTSKSIFFLLALFGLMVFVSCTDDDGPLPGGNEEEEITRLILTFTPTSDDGEVVTATWLDADGEGTNAPVIDPINLVEGVEYTLTMALANTLENPAEDKTSEIQGEAEDHMFFFGFTEGIFADPTGNGNIDRRGDDINYVDFDDNQFPLGLTTTWTAGGHTDAAGEFTVLLKHQPEGQKTADSDALVGGTDISATFPLNIVEESNEEEEEITQVTLTFTPEGDGEAVVATWLDEDGEGVMNPIIDEIELEEGVEYTLAITLTNTLEDPDEDKTAEILAEDDEHMFFFEFTNNIFADPLGNGNADSRGDDINYNDFDENQLPVGLSTTWTAGAHTDEAGEFTVILKHQPGGQKTADSDINVGGTDVTATFPLSIVEDENAEEEEITRVVLTFSPTAGGDDIVVTWFDEDGEGVGNPVIDDIVLAPNTQYDMEITLTNTLADPDEDITAEILEEDDEHMFFFGFTEGIFSDPTGDGNIGMGDRDDDINYSDQDENQRPVGLATTWTTGAAATGTFTVLLKHQPAGQKTDTSDSTVGGTDVNADFDITIQ